MPTMRTLGARAAIFATDCRGFILRPGMVAEDKQPLDAASEAREDGFAAFFLLRERTMQTHLALSALLLAGFVPAADPDPELEHALGVLKTRSISPDGPELLRFFRERTLTDADRARLADAVRRLADEDFSVREKATAELMRAGRQALTYLREAANDPDLERSRRARDCIEIAESGVEVETALAAARVLEERRPEGTVGVLLAYFAQAQDEVLEERLLRVLTQTGVKDGRPERLLVRSLTDTDPGRRTVAAHVLGRKSPENRPAVQKLLADSDPRVRFEAAEALVRAADRNAVPVLIDLLGTGPLPLAWRAQETLYHLAGERSPAGLTREAERGKVRDAWAAWWKEARLDLAKVSFDENGRGVFLVSEADNAGVPRHVCEYGPDGKRRWKIGGIDSPSDAQLLPGGRILVAEASPSRVTERDRDGKVLRTIPTEGYLTTCQRLANGNTFIATYSKVMEVDRNGKTIWSLGPPEGGQYTAQKLRDGRIVTAGSSAVVERDTTGKVLRKTPLPRQESTFSRIEVLNNGRYLVALYSTSKVIEFDSTGKVYFEIDVKTASSAIRLPNGNTLVTSMDPRMLVEFDRAGKQVSSFPTESRPFRVRRY